MRNSVERNRLYYVCVGLHNDGLKEILGIWVGKGESSSFWMSMLTDLNTRGIEDSMVTVTDNLNSFTQTIKSVFSESITKICVVHPIRNFCKYVVWKEKEAFTADLKNIYNASTKEATALEPDLLEQE